MIKCGKDRRAFPTLQENGEEHSIIWWMFMAVTMNSATFMGKNFQDYQNSSVNTTTDLTLKKMFDISAKSVTRTRWDLKCGYDSLGKHSWKYLSSIGDESESSIFNAQKSTSSRILCCVLEGFINILSPTKLGIKGLNGSSLTKATEIMTVSMESRLNSSGTSSQDSLRCSSAVKSQIFWAN